MTSAIRWPGMGIKVATVRRDDDPREPVCDRRGLEAVAVPAIAALPAAN